ncbi:MAG: 2-phospho-L-lactate guanylyltransferase [Anaerolineales bacterium]|nr:2-phospho-L-lactate guanylyltransferase [Anaerolineales bacterium]
MKCWVIVPVKRLSAAKSRLAPILTLRQRRELVCSLLAHSLIQLNGINGIRGIIVVGRDRAVRRIAAPLGALFIAEKPHDGLNRALARAAREAVRCGADAVMVLPADLPRLRKSDIVAVLRHAGKPPFMGISPDRLKRGTNLLLLTPPGLIRFSFGERSYRRHITAARRAGARVREYRLASLADDLDFPEDVVRLCDEGKIPRGKQREL